MQRRVRRIIKRVPRRPALPVLEPLSPRPAPAAASELPEPVTAPAAVEGRISKKATGIIGIAVACSRVLGLIRDQVFTHLFGTGFAMDVFVAAFRVPNLLRDLFAEGALSTAFVTTFSKKIATEGDRSAWRLANKMATLTAIFMSAITLLGILFAPWIVRIMTSGYGPEKLAAITFHTRLMFPFILSVSLAALVMGMLNAKSVFGMPAMASSFFNLGSITGGVLIGYWLDPHFGMPALVGLSIGTLIGGLLQFGVQLPVLYKAGFRFHPDFQWRDDGVRQILTLMGPAVIAASSVQVNVLVNSNFASHIGGNGPMSWLSIAFRLMQLPLGMFGVALGTVTLPLVSRFAANPDLVGVRTTLSRGMRMAFLLTLPSAVGLILLAEPIISVLFQRGRFNFESTLQCAAALRFYAFGLVAYSCIKVLAPAFYALDRRNLPMIVSFISIGINFTLNWIFTYRLGWGHRGLAFSTSIVAIINFVLLYGMMMRETHGLETRSLLWNVFKLALAAAPMAAVCIGAQHWIFLDLQHLGFFVKLIGVAGTIGLAVAVYGGMAILLRIDEVEDVVRMVKRKFSKR